MDGSVPMRPMRPGSIEIDDSRLRDMWARHQQRSLFTARAVRVIGIAAVLGIAVVLAAIALAFWALQRKPPVINIGQPSVNVTVPKQEAPVVNIAPPAVNIAPPAINLTLPPPAVAPMVPQAPPPRASDNKVVTEYTVFQTVEKDGYEIVTGWNYHNSNDTQPYTQYCYWHIGRTQTIELAKDGTLSADLLEQVRDVGVSYADAVRYAQSCQWVR